MAFSRRNVVTSSMRYLEHLKTHAHWVIIACFFLFGAATIMTFPPVHYLGDELGMMRYGENFVDSLRSGNFQKHLEPKLYYLALWSIDSVFGAGIVQARALSLVCSVLVLWLVYVLGLELGGRATGLVALLLVTGDYTFAWNSRLIRPEMVSTLVVLAAFAALVIASGRKHAVGLVFASALLVALSINVHPNNLQYVAAMALLYPILFRKRLRSKETLVFAGGLLAGLVFWMLLVYMPKLAIEAAGSAISAISDGGASSVSASLAKVAPFPFLKENIFSLFGNAAMSFGKDYLIIYLQMADSLFPNRVSFTYYASLVAVGVGLAMFTEKRWKAALLVGFPALALFLNYFLTKKFGYWHMVEVHPFLSLASAVGVCAVSERFAPRMRIAAVSVFIVALPFVGYWDQLSSVRSISQNYNYARLLQSVSDPIASRGDVMGHELYYPAFLGRYKSMSFDVEQAKGYFDRCKPLKERVARSGARFILMDDIVRGMMVTACGKPYYRESLRWLSLNARLLAHVREPYPNYWAPGRILQNTYVYEIAAWRDATIGREGWEGRGAGK